jgi:glycosyltransferase involved in cell wall biosynthesis
LFLSRFKSESFGLVLIEAMDLGAMPVINDNPILKDTLKDFTYEELSISNSLTKLYDLNIEHRKLIKNSDIVKLIYYPENFKNKILNYL